MIVGIQIYDAPIKDIVTGEKSKTPTFLVAFPESEEAYIIPVKLLRVMTDSIRESFDRDEALTREFIEDAADEPMVPITTMDWNLAMAIIEECPKDIMKSGDEV